jgi:hypothetical protein
MHIEVFINENMLNNIYDIYPQMDRNANYSVFDGLRKDFAQLQWGDW